MEDIVQMEPGAEHIAIAPTVGLTAAAELTVVDIAVGNK